MQPSLINYEKEKQIELVNHLLISANGAEVHYSDIAYFLKLDPYYMNVWMKKNNRGYWINGRDKFWWKWIVNIENYSQ
jgi:hypothetical protein